MDHIDPLRISFRKPIEEDGKELTRWLLDEQILRWFPMCNEKEVADSVRVWMGFATSGAGLTALIAGKPCGMFNLYIQSFKKLSHTCLFSIIVDKEYRGQGIGAALITEGKRLAKENFGIEILHLEVYEGNPAQRLYERMGFVVYGKQPRFIKESGQYLAKIFMQIKL